jgi:hypothetical protein
MEFKLKEYVIKRRTLFWDIEESKLSFLSQEAVVERILAYGDLSDFRGLIDLLGRGNLKTIYKKICSKRRVNLRPETINYFNLYFKINV